MDELIPSAALDRPVFTKRVSVRVFIAGLAYTIFATGGFTLTSLVPISPLPLQSTIARNIPMLFLLLLGWGLLGSFFALCVALPLLFFRARRDAGVGILLAAFVFLFSLALPMYAIQPARARAFARLAERSLPLVAAVHRFYNETGRAPKTLDELVPAYLETIPGTQMCGYPKFDYFTGNEDNPCNREPWCLWLSASQGPPDFDSFLYLPSENYPARGDSGRYERMGRWAYYHE